MPKNEHSQGIVLDEQNQEQPQAKERAQTAVNKEHKDEPMQEIRGKSGF